MLGLAVAGFRRRNWETMAARIVITSKIRRLVGMGSSAAIGARIVAIFDMVTQIPMAVEVRMVG